MNTSQQVLGPLVASGPLRPSGSGVLARLTRAARSNRSAVRARALASLALTAMVAMPLTVTAQPSQAGAIELVSVRMDWACETDHPHWGYRVGITRDRIIFVQAYDHRLGPPEWRKFSDVTVLRHDPKRPHLGLDAQADRGQLGFSIDGEQGRASLMWTGPGAIWGATDMQCSSIWASLEVPKTLTER